MSRHFPTLVVGPGERFDCANYEACLARFRHPRDVQAHCPPDCFSFARPDRSRELLHAAASRPGAENPADPTGEETE